MVIFKFSQHNLIRENKLVQNLKVSSVEECDIRKKKFPTEDFTTQEVIEIKKIFGEDSNLKYIIDKNILTVGNGTKFTVEKLEDEWFICKAGSFTHIENHYIIDGFNDVRELLKLLPFTLSVIELFISDQKVDYNKIDKSTIFYIMLSDESSVYEKIEVVLQVLNSELLNDSDVLELLSTKCKDITLLVRNINVIYKNNKDILWNSQLCLDLLKNNS